MSKKIFNHLPKPEGHDYIYGTYITGSTKETDGIEVPAGSRFFLRDGFQDRTMNGSTFYFWLEPEDIELDSHFYYSPFGISEDDIKGSDIRFLNDGEMAEFPENLLFKKTCNESIEGP